MTDEPTEDEAAEEPSGVEMAPPSESDWCEWDGGDLCFPHGAQWFSEVFDAQAIRTHDKTGVVEVLVSQDEGQTYKWLDVAKLKAPGKLVAINGDKAK